MIEIEFSAMSREEETDRALQQALTQFEAQSQVRVRLRLLDWVTGWAELVKVALYSHGPDVSEIGTTWVSNLVALNALHPFTPAEVMAFGGGSAFLRAAWQSGISADQQQVLAIPWLADVRVLYYRRDLLAKAGVEEQTAFRTPEQLAETLERLRASGEDTPWVVPTRHTLITLHNVASWVWHAGGDFMSADGKRVMFNEPEARRGFHAYYELGRYLSSTARNLEDLQANELFKQGRAAATLSGPWLVRPGQMSTAVSAPLGAAVPPGVPFVGGSNLIVWRHCLQPNAAVELIRYLTSDALQTTFPAPAGLLPVRLDALADPAIAEDPIYRVMSQGLKSGRSFPTRAWWGLVEDKLSAALTQVWTDVLADPQSDLDAILTKHLDPLAQRLTTVLSSRT